MSFEARCPQCLFVSRQLGEPIPCLLHVSQAQRAAGSAVNYDEPYEFGRVRPTADRLGPFSLREYVRLLLLRSRVREERSPLDGPAQEASLVGR